MRTCLVLLFSLACALPIRAEETPSLATDLGAFLAEADATKRTALGFSIAARWPDAAVVAKALPAARTYGDAAKGEIIHWDLRSRAGTEHMVFAYVPASYSPATPMPVLVWLHGAVGMEQPRRGLGGVRGFQDVAEEEGFLVLGPSSRRGVEWWTPAGVALVRDALADLARTYHIDGNRVALAGFSDGASGAMHIHAHDPDPYAVFLPMMPHPLISRLAGGPAFRANVRARPMLAISGGRDRLYPSARVKPTFEELKAAGADLEWKDLPDADHAMADVLPEQWEHLRRLWKERPRRSLPASIAWESAAPELDGRHDWVEIVEVDPKAPSAPGMQAAPLQDPTKRAVLGVNLDRSFEGPGLRIETVSEGSAAAAAGFQDGDILLEAEGKPLAGIRSVATLAGVLATLTDHQGTFRVQRGDKELELRCQPRALPSAGIPRPPALGYDRPSGRIEAQVLDGNVIDVKTYQIKVAKLHLASGLVDLEKPVIVKLNGKTVHEQVPQGNVGYLLSEAIRAGPGAPVWQASILLRP